METSLTNFDIYSSSRSVFLFHEYFWLYRCTASWLEWRLKVNLKELSVQSGNKPESVVIRVLQHHRQYQNIPLSERTKYITYHINQWADQTIFRLHTQYRGRRRRMRSKWFPGPHWIRTNISTVWQSQSFRCFSFTSLADFFHSRYIFSSFGIIFSNHVDKILNLKPRMDIS